MKAMYVCNTCLGVPLDHVDLFLFTSNVLGRRDLFRI